MPITEQDYRDHAKRFPNAHPHAVKQSFNEGLLKQAVVDAQLLTGHPGWDKYLERLQAVLDEAEQYLSALHTRVAGAYNGDDLRFVQCEIRETTGKINALNYCMSLPSELVKEATDHGLFAGYHD